MRRTLTRSLLGLAAALVAVLIAVLLAPGTALSQRVEEVWVANFPEVQEVRGKVGIEGTIRHGELARRQEVVSPVARHEVLNLIAGGTVETDGFTSVVLSLQGQVKDTVFSPGTVGALLVPDEEPVLRALREGGRIQFPLEVRAQLSPEESTHFASEPTPRRIGFPRYRVFFYNSSDRSVDANLYVYLAN